MASNETPGVHEAPLSRAAVLALGAAGVALVLAVVTVIVVLGRSGSAPASAREVIELEADAAVIRTLLTRAAVVETPSGLRLVDPRALGLTDGDVLTTLGGRPLDSVASLHLGMRAAIGDRAVALLFEIDRGGERRVVRLAARGDLAQPVVDDAVALTPTATDPDQQEILDGITQIDETNFEITRSADDQIMANPMAVARGARVVPSVKNGQPNGFKLYAIRPSSLYSRLGFQNGDTIHAINELEITTMDKALEVYTQLRDADVLVFEMTRRGRAESIKIVIR